MNKVIECHVTQDGGGENTFTFNIEKDFKIDPREWESATLEEKTALIQKPLEHSVWGSTQVPWSWSYVTKNIDQAIEEAIPEVCGNFKKDMRQLANLLTESQNGFEQHVALRYLHNIQNHYEGCMSLTSTPE